MGVGTRPAILGIRICVDRSLTCDALRLSASKGVAFPFTYTSFGSSLAESLGAAAA